MLCRVVHNHLWITTTIIPGKWDCGVGMGGGGGSMKSDIIIIIYVLWWLPMSVRIMFVTWNEHFTWNTWLPRTRTQGQKKEMAHDECDLSIALYGWVGGLLAHWPDPTVIYVTSHMDPKKQNQPKVQLWHWKVGTSVG